MSERTYRYRREDFRPLPLKLEHMTMCINFAEGRVDATNSLEMTARADLSQVVLDAKDLQIHEVRWCPLPGTVPDEALVFDYRKDEDRLIVTLPRVMTAGERFCIRTVTTCIPMGNILEGIYKDTTPPGGPQQYMSQCQQWGFQRIMPVFDDCTAKCTMTTTIEADARYTHLISNGNICHSSNPAGKPVPKSDDPTRQVITYENPIPMAPYLFIVCAGTWDMLADEVVYPSGRTVRLEYLVPPGMTDAVRIPMEILKESILWVEQTQAYEYSAETYRTICMNKSNFGGMENVGNTTIVTDSAVITEHTLDAGLLYAYAVIVHEFEHNQCGSETTMETPFDVWLNEAYTVDVERQFMAQLFDPSFVRLNQIEGIRNPLLGPLAVEDAGYAGRIVREGFNDPEELIDGVTYVKAAEVIRMLRLLIGEEKFLAAKQLYFTRYRNGNADTEQFFACFEEISGISLRQFREGWLYRAGYPKVAASVSYDADTQRCSVRFEQESAPGTASFHFPVELALVDDHGHDLPDTARTVEIRDVSTDIVFENILNPPAFVSLNRDFSFYGTLRHEGMSKELLALQAQLDGNVCNRVDAFRRLTDMERIKLLEDENAAIDPHWLSIYGELLDDASLSPAVKAYLLRIDEQPVDRAYLSWYQEQVRARERLMLAVNGAFHDKLVSLYHAVSVNPLSGDRSPKAGIEQRMLKNV
ncbi:MAG TPA: M1 family metallopeptidase, partial [Dissulfurispiraceae bacterium]|nr:M1 family metallopeptidase [Dissulfurispiraceae bacterium]